MQLNSKIDEEEKDSNKNVTLRKKESNQKSISKKPKIKEKVEENVNKNSTDNQLASEVNDKKSDKLLNKKSISVDTKENKLEKNKETDSTSSSSSGKKNKKNKKKSPILSHGTGRRKTSVSRAYLSSGTGNISINNRDYHDYFKNKRLHEVFLAPFNLLKCEKDYDVKINVNGGGASSQASAIRLSISICLSKLKLENRTTLKDVGFLTTDSRRVERKKYGHKKARKSFQFSKR